MNQLRQLIEDARAGSVRWNRDMPNDIGHEAVQCLIQHGESAQCFLVGEIFAVARESVIPQLCRLPFEVTWVEGFMQTSDGIELPIGLLAFDIGFPAAAVYGYGRNKQGRWSLLFGAWTQDLQREWWRTQGFDPEVLKAFEGVLYGFRAFLSTLNCCNVERRLHAPSEALQKARQRRGKQPLFSYWTLDLKGERVLGPALGGTHASPRVHLRRGHPRQYKPGQWTWVQPHAVGRRELGIVHKDYAMPGAA